MLQPNSHDLYMNMQQFSDMKLAARQNSRAAGKAAAQQFEGLFIQMMLKEMRAAAKFDESQHSSNMDFYTDMYDKQLSMTLSKQGGIGIAEVLEKQINRFLPEGQTAAGEGGKELPVYRLPAARVNTLPMPVMTYQAQNPAVQTYQLDTAQARASDSVTAETSSLQTETLKPFYGWSDRQSFISDLWPHAQKAASQLGVSAKVLVAQSALETGWGRHAMKKPDGSIAFNLFGIKAGQSWRGQGVVHNTLEFRQGAMQQESARFRAYDSVAEAMDDYVSFVKSSTRYEAALNHSGSDTHYIKNLHKAGYATDPQYASKIINIMNRPALTHALAALTQSGEISHA